MVRAMFAVALAVATALPAVGEVHARFVDALGGEHAVLRPQYVTTYGHYDVYGSDGKVKRVSFVRYGAAGFKQLEIDRSPNGRVSRTGFNDGVGWAVSPYPHGRPQVATGDFLQSARRDADIYYWGHISRYFLAETVVGIERFAGHDCYHVRGTTRWGNENNQYFDRSTGLLVGYAFHQWNATNTGREATLTRQVFDKYRDFHGLLVPMRNTVTDGGRLLVVEQDSSLDFAPIDDRVFDLPASVTAAAARR
jgi:hypothetical protein